ncbi:MAG: response regulator [Terricaulis sp.]
MAGKEEPEAGQAVLALVDDDAAVRHALSFSLETKGFFVVAFGDGESALAAGNLAAWRCMVLDLKLPGMSGLDLFDHLRRRGVRAPALLITTHPTLATRTRAAAAGVDIVEKPLLDDGLTTKIAHLWANAV